jgi:hypothetical protein
LDGTEDLDEISRQLIKAGVDPQTYTTFMNGITETQQKRATLGSAILKNDSDVHEQAHTELENVYEASKSSNPQVAIDAQKKATGTFFRLANTPQISPEMKRELLGIGQAMPTDAPIDQDRLGTLIGLSTLGKYINGQAAEQAQTQERLAGANRSNAEATKIGAEMPGGALYAPSMDMLYQRAQQGDPQAIQALKMRQAFEVGLAGSKAAADTQSRINVQTAPANVEAAANAALGKKWGIWEDSQTGKLVYGQGYKAPAGANFEEVSGGEVWQARSAMRQLGDVQTDTTRYTQAAQNAIKTPLSTSDYTNMHEILNKAGALDLNVAIAEGGSIKIPVLSAMIEGLNREVQSEAYAALSPQAKDLIDGYIAQVSAVPAYQKALTNSGKLGEHMMELEIQNIGNPTLRPQDILRKQQRFQQNVDRASDGFPTNLPGIQAPQNYRPGAQPQQPSWINGSSLQNLLNGDTQANPFGR